MNVFNALQVKAGAKIENNRNFGALTQPRQFLPFKEKDMSWIGGTMDFLEFQGLKQLKRNSNRLLKNYNLAKGIIDRSDYIVDSENEMSAIVESVKFEDNGVLD